MAKAKVLKTNFTAGELSPRVDLRSDLAKYPNGAQTLENYLIFPQGGIYRAYGSRYVAEVKDSSVKTRLLPFVFSRTDAFIIEFGNLYVRFYKNGARVTLPSQPITNITQANPAVVTYNDALGDNFANGDRVVITGVAGMTQVNDREFTVANVNTGANTFQLSGVDSSAYGAYTSGGTVAEIYQVTTTYTSTEIFDLHITQSADVLFIDHPVHAPRKLSRAGDTNWTITDLQQRPPPTIEVNTDIGTPANADLNLTAITGINQTATATASVFLAGDVDRNIIVGASRAVITTFTSATQVQIDILDDFISTSNPKGTWKLDKSPSSYANPDKRTNLGQTVTINFENDSGADQNAIRTADFHKYIKILGGVVFITQVINAHQIKGVVRVAMKKETNDPAAVPGGNWTLEVPAWDTGHFPRTNGFFQGRLEHAGEPPGTFILSASDDFENYGVGSHADAALQYNIARQQASIVWCGDLGNLVIATPESIFAALAPGTNQPLGGDVIPMVVRQDAPGSMAVQPLVTGTTAIYIEANGRRVRELRYSSDQSQRTPYVAIDLTLLADHVCGSGFTQDQIAWAESPNRHAFFVRKDGQLAALTYFNVPENVVGWSRRVTDGSYESVSVIPHPDGDRDQVWAIVKRTVNGATKRYIEYFEDNGAEFVVTAAWSSATTYAANDSVLFNGVAYFSLQSSNTNHQPDSSPTWWQRARTWTPLYTDCAKVYSGAAVTNVAPGFLTHLEGKTVDVVADGSYKGTRVVASGKFAVDLLEAAAEIEIGLHYDSKCVTLQPSIDGAIVRGTKKLWQEVRVVLQNTIGGSIQTAGSEEQIPMNIGGQPMDIAPPLFTGDKPVPVNGIDDEGRITLWQRLPYPQTILGIHGKLNLGDL